MAQKKTNNPENQINTTHKTLEFRLEPTPEQEAKLEDWLLVLRWTWNRALGLMEEYKAKNPYCKEDKKTYLASWVFDELHLPIKKYYARKNISDWCDNPVRFYKKKLKNGSLVDMAAIQIKINQVGWWSDIEPKTIKKGSKEILVNPVAIAPDIPFLEQLPTSKKNTPLTTIFGHRYHKDRIITYKVKGEEKQVKFTDCPFKFIQGILITLSGAWIEFTKRPKEVSPPKFKNSKHPIKSLIHYNAEQLKFDFENKTVTPHKSIGAIKINGLNKRIVEGTKFNPLKLCKKASGWFLQLTVEQELIETKLTGNVCGIDPGKIKVASLDNDFLITPNKPMLALTKKLTRLQRQLSRKGRMNNIDRQQGEPWIRSKKYEELSQKVGQLHEKVARSRRSFQHWHTSRLTDWFDLIFFGDYKSRLAKAKAKEKTNEKGEVTGYAKNGQAQQKGRNKSTADVAAGQFLELLKTKSLEKAKVAIAINEDYTSQMCPSCGNIHKKKLSNRVHHCRVCGFKGDRDAVGAINIKLKGLATLLLLDDKELSAIPALDRVTKGNIKKYLEDETKETLAKIREPIAGFFNPWLLYLVIGSQQYIDRVTNIYPDANLGTSSLQLNLNRLQEYYNEKKGRSAKTYARIEAASEL